MTPERWQRINRILDEAWERDTTERAAFLDEACAGDPELLAEVEALLASDENRPEFLAAPAMDRAVLNSVMEGEESGLTGKRVGRYTIQGLIGKGGMGAVYRAVREDDFRMQVAIKLLKRGTDTDAALKRFRAERQILAGLQHPHIARMLDGGATEEGLPYFVMELVDGTPLLEYAAPLPVRRRLELFRSVCHAVQHAHQNQIVHRDIKPANILVTREGIPKLLDFGIAKLLDPAADGGTPALTVTGMRMMTPGYASPEQVRGEQVSAGTDVYSLGAVLYELLTGQRAHAMETNSAQAIEKEICTRDPRKPSSIAKGLDPDLDNIILMALRKDPARRYASAAELAGDLDRFLRDEPVRARKESPMYRCRKFLKRNRLQVGTAAASMAIVLAVVAGVGKFAGSDGARSIAVLPLENLSGDKEQEYFADGVTDALINGLSEIQGLRVISRTSSMSFKGVRRPLPEIARSLGVRTVAEGSVLRSGSRVRVAVRLMDAPNERAMWSSTYEGDLADVLALQEKIAAAIAEEIGVTLNSPNRSRASRSRRVDLGAYDAYLKGRHDYFNSFDQDSMKRTIAWFQKALALDPSYAPAYAGLADCYYMSSTQYLPPTDAMPKARSAALKAIELDPTLAEAHATLALVRSLYEFNHAEAEKGFRRAIELKPSDSEVHLWYALHLAGLGRFRGAAAEIEEAQKLDPVSLSLNAYAGAILYYAHRYDQVIQQMEKIVQKDPSYQQTYCWLGLAHEQKGDFAKAIVEMLQSIGMASSADANDYADGLAQLGHMYAVSGRTEDARKALAQIEEVSRRHYVTAWDFALLYTGLGEREEAFRWLQKVEEDRSEMFALLKVDPRFDSLHSDPRWAGVLRSIGMGK